MMRKHGSHIVIKKSALIQSSLTENRVIAARPIGIYAMSVAENAEKVWGAYDGDGGDGGDARTTKRGCWKSPFLLSKQRPGLHFSISFIAY